MAHANHDFASPIGQDRAALLLQMAGLREGVRVLDIGCGFGGWSVLSAAHGALVTAVDFNPEFIRRGMSQDSNVKWVNEPYTPELIEAGSHDVVLCIGSSQALGTLEATLQEGLRVLKPGGSIVLGEGYWRQKPDPAYLAILGAEPDEMTTHAGNAKRVTEAGWTVSYSTTATEEEWDVYEGLYRSSMVRWITANQDDPEAEAFQQRSDRWYEAYLAHGRETLGFGYYVAIRRP